MKTCLQCPKTLRRDYKLDVCQKCLSVCECGSYKDWRAINCRSCGSRKVALKQWANMRGVMMNSLTVAGEIRRRKYEDLEPHDFREAKPDGRRFARYRDSQNHIRTIYRYQWIWRQTHGDIPKGYVIHHLDHDPTNDGIENLQLLTMAEHAHLHQQDVKMAKSDTATRHHGL